MDPAFESWKASISIVQFKMNHIPLENRGTLCRCLKREIHKISCLKFIIGLNAEKIRKPLYSQDRVEHLDPNFVYDITSCSWLSVMKRLLNPMEKVLRD